MSLDDIVSSTTPEESITNAVARYVVATTTIWSGASYIYSKDAVKILTPPPSPNGGEEKAPGDKKKEDDLR